MSRRAATLGIPALSAAIWGCTPAQPPAPPPRPVAAAPAPPARTGTMVCRSSVDGRPAKCGTPGAVMVGIKFD